MDKLSRNGTSTSSTLPKVHTSPKPSSNISFQSILQPVPKLYKYSADQLEVVIHRRTGEVESISRKDVQSCSERVVELPSPFKQANNLEASRCSPKAGINDNTLDNSTKFPSTKEPLTASSKETVEVHPSLPNEEILCETRTTLEQATESSEFATTVAGECSSCETLLVKLRHMEAEMMQLRELLESKDIQLKKSRHRLEAAMNKNNRLKSAASGIRNGMNSLANIIKSSNSDSEVNDKRIVELIQRAWPEESISKTPTSFKSIDASLDKMRDHVNRLSILPQFGVSSPTPSPISLLNNKTDSLLSFNVNLINGKCDSEA